MALLDKTLVTAVRLAEESGAAKLLASAIDTSAIEAAVVSSKRISGDEIAHAVLGKLNRRSMSTVSPLEETRADAQKAYADGNWQVAKRLYGEVVEATKNNPTSFGRHYEATGRLARADFHLGDYSSAESGFRRFLGMNAEPSILRGHVFNEMADIMEVTGRGSRAKLLRAHATGNLADKPDFSSLSLPLKVPDTYAFSDEGISQAQHLYEYEMLRKPLANGFIDFGQPMFLGPGVDASKLPMMTVLDHAQDPALKIAATSVEQHFGHLKQSPAQYAAALTEYTGKLFRPGGRDAFRVEQLYSELYEGNVGQQYFFGEYLRRNLGVCNQRAAFIKTMADQAGLEATFYRGYVNKELTGQASVPHDFATIFINGKEKVYDAGIKVIGENFSRHSGRGYTSLSIDGTWIGP